MAGLDLDEAQRLRELGWRGPILLLEGVFAARDLELCSRLGLWHTVHHDAQIDMLAGHKTLQPHSVFLKINTGMNRLGFAPELARAAWTRLQALPQVEEVGLMMHFATADEATPHMQSAWHAFARATHELTGPRSACNSAALLRHPEIAAQTDWVRPGIALYGSSPDASEHSAAHWYYEIVAPGFKYNMTDMAAALGRVQLKRLPAFWQRRQQLAERYLQALRDVPLVLPAAAPAGEQHSWHLFVLRLSDAASITRDEVIQQLSDAGIGTSVHYVPLHRQPYWRDRYGLRPEQFPVADAAYQRMFSIPLFTAMSDAEQERIITALRQIVQ